MIEANFYTERQATLARGRRSDKPGRMDISIIIALVLSLLSTLVCCGGGIFFFILVLGIFMLRRRKKKVTMKAAVKAGAESVSQVFVRGKGGQIEDDDDDDDDK
jgi:hypothetical protein